MTLPKIGKNFHVIAKCGCCLSALKNVLYLLYCIAEVARAVAMEGASVILNVNLELCDPKIDIIN